jgi:modulator of FtsH protease HflC
MLLRILLVVVVLLVLVLQSAFIVKPFDQGIVLQFGKPVRIILEPGLYFRYPFVQEFIQLDKRVLGMDAKPEEYITLDKKRLMVDTISRWRIVKPLLFYQTVRDLVGANARLNDVIVGRLRQEIAGRNFKDFIREEREAIMAQVTEGAAEKAQGFGITVIDVRIRRVDLPEEVQASVFARMKAERERIAKRYRAEGDEQAREIRANAQREKEILLAEAYRTAEVLRGEGDAGAVEIYAEAYGQDPEFFSFVRHLEVYKRVFNADTTLLLRPNSDILKYLNGPGVPSPGGSSAEDLRERK